MIIFAAVILLLVGLGVGVFYYLERLVEGQGPDGRRWFWNWVCKGLVAPILFWMLWNFGIIPGLPALLPQVAQAQSGGGSRASTFLVVTTCALFVIGSFWAAVTFAWFLVIIAAREDIRADFLGACVVWSVVMVPLALLIIYLSGWLAAGFAVALWLLPIAHSSLPLLARKKVGPLYSRAIGKMKLGKYEDAEWEVIHQLEKAEDDFEGWLMLADLYANHFDDLAGAQRTIDEICGHPATTPSQFSISLHRLADWHLKLGEDPVAARRALEEICRKMPGTHLATMAQQRINQLPGSREELRARQKGRTIHLPALNHSLEEPPISGGSESGRDQALAQANRFVDQLKKNPDDVTAREELARLFAERLDRVELAIEQVELLLLMPEQPPAKAAEWLSLLAAWQLKYRRDAAAARTLLERLMHEYPHSAQAFAAQRHLKLMELEERRRERQSVASAKRST